MNSPQREAAKQAIAEIAAVWRIAGIRACARYFGGILSHLPAIIQERKLSSADLAMGGRDLSFRVMGCDLRLSGEYFSGARELWGRQVYFAQPGFSIGAGDTVVDLGANVGLFSLLAAKLGAKVTAVEMQSGFLPLIEANLRANGVSDQVEIVWGIIGAGSGIVTDHGVLDTASHYLETAPELSIKELIRSRSLRQIDFLKIDIEGSEFDLFRKGTDWLSIVRRIAMEVHCHFGDSGQLTRTLTDAGFHVVLLENRGNVVPSLTGEAGYLFASRASG